MVNCFAWYRDIITAVHEQVRKTITNKKVCQNIPFVSNMHICWLTYQKRKKKQRVMHESSGVPFKE